MNIMGVNLILSIPRIAYVIIHLYQQTHITEI